MDKNKIANELIQFAKVLMTKNASSDVLMERDIAESIDALQDVLKIMQKDPKSFPASLALRIESIRKDCRKLHELANSNFGK